MFISKISESKLNFAFHLSSKATVYTGLRNGISIKWWQIKDCSMDLCILHLSGSGVWLYLALWLATEIQNYRSLDCRISETSPSCLNVLWGDQPCSVRDSVPLLLTDLCPWLHFFFINAELETCVCHLLLNACFHGDQERKFLITFQHLPPNFLEMKIMFIYCIQFDLSVKLQGYEISNI